MMKRLILFFSIVTLCSCNSTAQKAKEKVYKVNKTDTEWKAELSDISYYVLRQAGTEPAFSNVLNDNHDTGTYVCAACNTPLFKSEYKYDSGSGWPSFDREIKGNIEYAVDYKLGYGRSEEICATCGGHLGHVFDDGPKETTGNRHCINGAALKFIPKKDE